MAEAAVHPGARGHAHAGPLGPLHAGAGPLARYADAVTSAAAVLLGEAVVVGITAKDELAGSFEMAVALGTLLPMAVALSAPLAAGGALLSHALESEQSPRGRTIVACLAVVVGLPVAYGVSSGRLLDGALRPAFVAMVTASAFAVAWWGTAPMRRVIASLKRASVAMALMVGALLVALLEVANVMLWPRLYPAFHLGLAVLTLWAAAAVFRVGRAALPVRRVWAGAAVLSVCALAAIGAPDRLRYHDNIRFIFLERAPILGHAVRLGALLAPPPSLSDDLPARAPSLGKSIDWSGRDVLLVTIDALRADHVHAYGYGRLTTPEIDALAAEAAVFDAAYTATPHTSYAITSLMTGKYMRPLLLQGVGEDSETWAEALRRYGYRTAAFYPPALFFVDRERFERFESRGLGFEYKRVEFASAEERATHVEAYVATMPSDQRLFLWVHLFEPHEPYVAHDAYPYGSRSIDRYDSEVAAADAGVGRLVRALRSVRPSTVVIVAADHGEEFGDHGGRYHGTTVYDEQVRVPLLVHAPGTVDKRVIRAPVGLVDLMPTVLGAIGVPVSPRVRGRDLGRELVGKGDPQGFAFAETDEHTLLAEGDLRLVCARRVGACRLFDVADDPKQLSDASSRHAEALARMKGRLVGWVSSMGRFENDDASSRSWPRALRRGIAGDAEAAADVAALLDDADVEIRRRAAEVLFDLRVETVSRHLQRSLQTDEDATVKRWAAVALTRLGQGAPLTLDLVERGDLPWRRLAALSLAEAGDDRGEKLLIAWWAEAFPEGGAGREPRAGLAFERARDIALALGNVKSRASVGVLARGLGDVRLRSHVAKALLAIGDEAARPMLGQALARERYHDARIALAEALVGLDGGVELRQPLALFMGVPDPMHNALEIALRAEILRWVGGPGERELARLRDFATSGVTIGMVVPVGGNDTGLRVIVRARSRDGARGEVRFGLSTTPGQSERDRKRPVPRQTPKLDDTLTVTLEVSSDRFTEVHASLPEAATRMVEPGGYGDFVIYATQNVVLDACAVVPLADELPPPPPEPWTPGD